MALGEESDSLHCSSAKFDLQWFVLLRIRMNDFLFGEIAFENKDTPMTKEHSTTSKLDSSVEDSFFESAPAPANRPLVRGLQITIFVVLIALSTYPYFRHQFPVLEAWTHPSSQAERVSDQALQRRHFAKALRGYKRALSSHDVFSSTHSARRLGRLHLKMSICFMHLKKYNKSIEQAELALKRYPGWKLPLPHRILLQLYPLQRQSKRLEALGKIVQKKYTTKIGLVKNLLLMHILKIHLRKKMQEFGYLITFLKD